MSERIYAYETLEPPPRLRVTGLRLDGSPRPALVHPAECRVDLFEGRSDWRRAELELELAADRDAAREFERRHGELAAVVVARCGPTRARQSAGLGRPRSDEARWVGTIELDRDHFRGRALLQPRLTAAIGGVGHRAVAEPDGWAAYFDEPTFLSPGGRLRLRWADFRAADADPLARQFADSTHVIAFGAGDEPPVILLNASFAGLRRLLEGDERDAAERAVRDLVRAGIARDVWMGLLAVAMAAIRAEDDGRGPRAQWPEAGWQRDVLRRILPMVAPGRPLHELLELADAEWRSHPGSCEFQARAAAAVGDVVRGNEAVRRLIQAREEGEES